MACIISLLQGKCHGMVVCFVIVCTCQTNATDPVESVTFPTPALHPKNSRLALDKAQGFFHFILPHWQIGVAKMLAEFPGK
ncbi:sugar nucleotide-binding protein [Janthinobacterium sp. GB4P2]|uniref:sugar nucleotide-binding protein n=1 Tax=Janthinobacterium sp. GB4P2 TaxID=3424189 RepID=UPI003F240551